MRFFANANYDFIGRRRVALLATAAFLVLGLVGLLLRGVNYSIEFTGGTIVEVRTTAPTEIGTIRDALEANGITGAEIQAFGGANDFVIRARTAKAGSDVENTEETTRAVRQALDGTVGAGSYEVLRSSAVSPKVGGQLRGQALMAILLSFIAVLAYLAVRFEWRFGVAAILATAHDILATIAFIVLLRLEVSLFVVAALLSIVGYSLNDTIVIFDRVRENLKKHQRMDFASILNLSVNETLPRTVLTGSVGIGTLLALAALGGDVVRPFALIMLFGIVIGTFSSVFVASPILLAVERKWPGPHARGLRGDRAAAPARPRREAEPVA
jgi:preprotein translocase subunit SecF